MASVYDSDHCWRKRNEPLLVSKMPAIQLYTGDWLKDPVAGCSLAAQGLWLRMMFIAHDSRRYGYLANPDGTIVDPDYGWFTVLRVNYDR